MTNLDNTLVAPCESKASVVAHADCYEVDAVPTKAVEGFGHSTAITFSLATSVPSEAVAKTQHAPAPFDKIGMAASVAQGTARKDGTRKCVRLPGASTIAVSTNTRPHFAPAPSGDLVGTF
jgi:hypothetical protein